MKILFDYQTFEQQKFGGVSRYFFELYSQFKKKEGVECEIEISYSSNQYIKTIPEINNKIIGPADFHNSFLRGFNFKGKYRIYLITLKFLSFLKKQILYNQEASIKHLEKKGFDIFHPTYYDTYFLNYIGDAPFVLTVHDMIHELFPEHFSENYNPSENKKKLCEKATKIIAISENTKSDLIKFYAIDETKISVIYHGNSLTPDFSFQHENRAKQLPEKYILYVGKRGTYKNFNFFLQSIAPILRDDNSIHLVCTGDNFTIAENKLLQKEKIKKQVHHIFASDNMLAFLYHNALLFAFPTLYEGFGMPILEAFSCECPIAMSNTSSLPEIGGEAAEYFNPSNAESIHSTIKNLVYNETLRTKLKQRGLIRSKDFSWQKTAEQTYHVYKEILS